MPNDELVKFGQGNPLAIPVDVIGKANIEHALALCRDAKTLKICDAIGFKTGGEYLNSLGRSRTFAQDAIKRAREPFNAVLADISAQGKPVIEAIIEAEGVVNAEMAAYDRIQKEEQRKAEIEKQRLAEEARRQKEAAAVAVETATTDEGFDAAASLFDAALVKADDAKAAVVPQVFKPTGAKTQKTAVIVSFDLSKTPLPFLCLDEAKVKKAILAGFIAEDADWLKWRIDEKFIGTGR